MNQIQLIEHFMLELGKVAASHGAESEYFTVAFFKLQAAKMGKPVKDITPWANEEAERLRQITLDQL